jgi:hypothetical protein
MFKIDTDEVIKLTVKLQKLNRSALPSAARNTLNNAAFETKKQIPIQGQKKFKYTRNKGFLKSFSTINKANGFNISKMESKAGLNGSKEKEVVDNLVSHEKGGILNKSKITPHDDARTGNSKSKKVRRKNYKSINAHDATPAYRSHKGTRKSKFVAAVMSTAKSGKKHMLMTNKSNGKSGIIYRLKSLKSNRKTGKLSFSLDKVYIRTESERATTKSKGFILASKNVAIKQIPEFYKKNAEFQIKKHWK